jgi:hypothetical protein
MNPATIFRTEVLASLTLNGPADRGRGRLLVLCADDALRSKFAARLGWSGMALAIDDPPWRRSCRSRRRRDAAAGGLSDVNQIRGMSGLSGIAPAVLRSLECTPSGREWSSP